MALINKPYTFSSGANIVAAEHNSNFDTIYNEFNGSITNANISASAAITDSKLAQLTTAGKVSGASFTLLGSIPSGGGTVPTTNLGSGSATSSTFLRGDQTWAAATPTAATALSGSVIQVVNTLFTNVASGSGLIPFDNSIPQKTEGLEVMTRAITPNNASNLLKITANLMCASSTTAFISASLLQDTTANALAATASTNLTANTPANITLIHYMTAGTTSSTTFKINIGSDTASTMTFNGISAGRIFGGITVSSFTIEEIKA